MNCLAPQRRECSRRIADRCYRRRAGFTLLEVLVVLTILGVVSTLGISAFVTVMSAWNEGKTLTELDAQAEEAFEEIRRDLADALSYELSGVALRGTSGDAIDTDTVPAAHNADDSVSIPIQGAAVGRARQRAEMVGYRVDRGTAEGSLIRTVGSLDEDFPTTGRQEVIARARTVAFRAEYLSDDPGRLWESEWHGPGHPKAVRISLTLEDRDRPGIQISRKAVLRVHVR